MRGNNSTHTSAGSNGNEVELLQVHPLAVVVRTGRSSSKSSATNSDSNVQQATVLLMQTK